MTDEEREKSSGCFLAGFGSGRLWTGVDGISKGSLKLEDMTALEGDIHINLKCDR